MLDYWKKELLRGDYIGEIFNLEVISEIEAKQACQYYKEQGWLDEMTEQVKSISEYKGFYRWKGLEVFNVRFKVSDIKQAESLRWVLKFDFSGFAEQKNPILAQCVPMIVKISEYIARFRYISFFL